MVWSKWKAVAALAGLTTTGLLCAGLAWSQQSTAWQPAGPKPAEVVTVKEDGKPPQQYTVQKSYRMADGRMAQELRNLATGEVMTVVDQGPALAPAPSKNPISQVGWTKMAQDTQPADVGQPQPGAGPSITAADGTMPPNQMGSIKSASAGQKSEIVQQQPVTGSSATGGNGAPKSSLLGWFKGTSGGQSSEGVQQQPSAGSSTMAGNGNSKSSLMGWFKGSSGGQSPEVAQQQQPFANSGAMAGDANGKSSLVGWFKGSSGGQSSGVMQEQPFTSSGAMASGGNSNANLVGWIKGTPGGQPFDMESSVATVDVKFRTVEEPGKAPSKWRVMAEWQTADGKKASQLQSVASGEMVTLVEMGPAQPVAGNQQPMLTASLYHWGHSATPPPGVPAPPGQVGPLLGPQPMYARAPNATGPAFGNSQTMAMAPQANSTSTESWHPTPSAQTMEMSPTTAFTPVNSDQQKSLFGGERVTEAPGSILPSSNTMSPVPPTLMVNNELPMIVDTGKHTSVAQETETPKKLFMAKVPEETTVIDPVPPMKEVKTIDTPKTVAAPRIVEAPRTVDVPKFSDLTRRSEGPSLFETPHEVETPKTVAAAKIVEGSTISDASTAKQAPKGPDLPKVTPSALPPLPPPPDSKNQLAGQTKTPLTPGQLLTSNGLPSLPPVASAPASQVGVSLKGDPLYSPEIFSTKRIDDKPAVPTKDIAKAPAAGSAQATDAPNGPLGGGSAMAAANGGDPRYLPALPPQAKSPMASTPAPGKAQGAVNPASYANAFTPPPSPDQMQQRPMTPAAYPMPMMPQGYSMPTMPQGYPMASMPMMPQGYAMPTMPTMPQGYAMASMPAPPAFVYANPAMDRGGMPVTGMSTQQCLNMLQSSIFPSQREMAVMELGKCDWRMNPQIVQILLTTAKEDPAAMVRAASVHALSRMGVGTEAVATTLGQLKSDADPRVRMEADQALAGIASTTGGVLPASAVNRQ